MTSFRTLNISIGWLLFAGALVVYTKTVEPTASFWDCAEYITAAYKLEVTHPPGAPLFLLVGKIFSLLAGNNLTKVAFWVNMSAVVSSSATIMVLFWIISLLARKAIGKPIMALTKHEAWLVWLSSSIGALCLIFCSTFWSNATEAETYALSTLLMCLTIWSMLNWAHLPLTHQSKRWLLLVVYLLGLSLGVRMFSLLTLPGLCLIYYFKKYKFTWRGAMISLTIGTLLIGMLYAGIILGTPSLILLFELFCVNTLGLPITSGAILLGILVILPLTYALFHTAQRRPTLHSILIGFVLILIGYSSYSLVPIRAKASPPMNESDPSNIIRFTSYLKREQYGYRPLLYGPHFAAQRISAKRTGTLYKQTAAHYEIIGYRHEPVFRDYDYVLFPRTWSQQSPMHIQAYKNILHLKAWERPSFGDQLYFFFGFQLPHFYLRYFFWNYAGRANDTQGATWLTPLQAFENPPLTLKQLPGRRNYLALPLLLGLIGIIFQYKRDARSLSVVISFFLMLGVALLVFLNPPPIEPRERDYIYVGSFIIFSIWIGLGASAVIETCNKLFKKKLSLVAGFLICLSIPYTMATQGWPIHDRSKRHFAVETAKNLLTSCAPNAILFTAGDNDTFPLWYVQEVEGFRKDVRVIVLSYANAGWYIKQLFKKVNDSDLLPLSISAEDYQQYGYNDFLPYIAQTTIQAPLDITTYIGLIRNHHKSLQIQNMFGEITNCLPCQELSLKIEKETIHKQELVPVPYKALIPERLHLQVKEGHYLEKRDLLLLDLISTNQWQRPIYFNYSSIHGINLDLLGQVVAEGLALRLLPIENNTKKELVNIPVMYKNIMHHFHWKGLHQPGVYYDDNYRLVFIRNHRMAFCSLAKALLEAGKKKKAEKVLLKCLSTLPDTVVIYDVANAYMVNLLFLANNHEVALSLIKVLGEHAQAILNYHTNQGNHPNRHTEEQMAILYEITKSLHRNGYLSEATCYQAILKEYQKRFKNIKIE